MKIAVCVKYVPDATADRKFEATTPSTGWVSTGCCPSSTSTPSRQALKIREDAGDDSEIVVVTMGPDEARAAILKSLQMGADAGVHVHDDAIHGSDAVATSLVLAKAIEQQQADLVICGMASTDGSMSVVPAMLAERLGLAAGDVRVRGHGRRRQGQDPSRRRHRDRVRRGDAAVAAVGDRPGQRAALPVVQGDHGGEEEAGRDAVAGRPRRRRRPGRRRRRVDAVEVSQPRPPRSAGTIVTDEDGTGADKLVEFLAGQKFI